MFATLVHVQLASSHGASATVSAAVGAFMPVSDIYILVANGGALMSAPPILIFLRQRDRMRCHPGRGGGLRPPSRRGPADALERAGVLVLDDGFRPGIVRVSSPEGRLRLAHAI